MNNDFQGNNVVPNSSVDPNSTNNSNVSTVNQSSNTEVLQINSEVQSSTPISNIPVVNPISNNATEVMPQANGETQTNTVANIPVVNPVSNNPTVVMPQANGEKQTNTSVSNIPVVNPVSNNVGQMNDATQSFVFSPTASLDSSNSNNVVQNSFPQGENLDTNPSNTGESISLDNQKKVDIEYKPPSKAKIIFMIFSFIVLLLFVIFLPEISSMINLYRSGAYNKEEEKITTGSMKCSLKTNTSNLDKNYDLLFKFKDNKLEKTEFVITTKGNPTEDEQSLDNLAAICTQLEENLKDATGVYIRCDYTTGKLVEKQSFDLGVIDFEQLNSAFAEAGGNNPEYQFGQDMDIVERSMKASGYTCTREK